MSLEDQELIIQVLFEHGFNSDRIYLSSQFGLYSLLLEFLEFNYEQLNLSFEWRPLFNTYYTMLSVSKIK